MSFARRYPAAVSGLAVGRTSVPRRVPAPPARLGGRRQGAEGGQLRQGAVLADVGVPRLARVRRSSTGVPVAAPVGGPAVGPR